MNNSEDRVYVYWLLGLMVLFSLRVIGQFIQMVFPVDFLPALTYWQGSTIPYSALLTIQLLILAVVARVSYKIWSGQLSVNRRLGLVLLILGSIYFLGMFLRLVLGFSVLAHHPWFAKSIPAFFHLVLAAMVLTIGRYHWRKA